MKKIMATLMAVMISSVMMISLVSYAEPEADTSAGADAASTEVSGQAEGTGDAAGTEEQTSGDELTNEEMNSLKYYIILDFADLDNIVAKQCVYSDDEAIIEKVKTQFSKDAEPIEVDGKSVLKVSESPLELESLASAGAECFVDEGIFGTKRTFVYVVGTITGNAEDIDGRETLLFNLGKRAIYTNGERISGGVKMDIAANKNCSLMASTYTVNWIRVLIAIMVLVVIVLLILIVVFSKKKKKLAEDAEANSEFVSEDNIFDQLVSENTEGEASAEDEFAQEITEEKENVQEEIEDLSEKAEDVPEEIEEAGENNEE